MAAEKSGACPDLQLDGPGSLLSGGSLLVWLSRDGPGSLLAWLSGDGPGSLPSWHTGDRLRSLACTDLIS